MPEWRRLEREGKVRKVPQSTLEATDVPARAQRRIEKADPDDAYLLPLAIASGAQWLLTRDTGLLNAAQDLGEIITIISPDWILENEEV